MHRDGVLVPVSVKAGDRVVLPGFGGVGVKVGEEVSFYFYFLLFISFSLEDCYLLCLVLSWYIS